ncbi:T6SS immunity protein Tli3 family protein [Chimaeribacter arupi]|uniref:T6SS immunity protein Tli3 family protein n=1 Tax=Chimaeribacter arupi TaxID=2060066 RepID=UPI000C7D4AFB|nr:hypothetical protein [Chimaeribacter arupi]PLR39002.1 hypothetical protein CYR23_02835 [Chimaeribacter arupi]
MRWDQSDGKVLSIIGIVMLVLYGAYKGLQFLAGLTMGASFGVGLGGMSGSQYVEESRRIETDAPAQVIYRIDNERFLTLENYIACDKGGRVYYNDTQRGIKTLLGSRWDEFNDRLGNYIAAYQGEVINGADNGYLAFPGAVTKQYCGSGNSARGCPVFFYFSSNYGKEFIAQVIGEARRTPERFSKLKFMVANDGVYLQDNYRDSLSEVARFRLNNGELISFKDERERELLILFKKKLKEKGMPYADGYNYIDQYIFDYVENIRPLISNSEKNIILDEYFDIKSKIQEDIYKKKLNFPVLMNKSMDNAYHCDNKIKAKTITYIRKNGKRVVIKNEE